MRKLTTNDSGIAHVVLLVALLLGLVICSVGWYTWQANNHKNSDLSPPNIVFAADDSVVVPDDLLRFLKADTKDDCKDYKGTNSIQGVSLVSIYQIVDDKYAKVALGCGRNLDVGFPVIKTSDGWKLLSGASYYVYITDATEQNPQKFPRCSIVDKYQISKEVEESCLEDKGEVSPVLSYVDIRKVAYP